MAIDISSFQVTKATTTETARERPHCALCGRSVNEDSVKVQHELMEDRFIHRSCLDKLEVGLSAFGYIRPVENLADDFFQASMCVDELSEAPGSFTSPTGAHFFRTEHEEIQSEGYIVHYEQRADYPTEG